MTSMTSKAKGHVDAVRSWSWSACKSRRKISRNTKISERVAHASGNNAHQFQGQKTKGQGILKVITLINAVINNAPYAGWGITINFLKISLFSRSTV